MGAGAGAALATEGGAVHMRMAAEMLSSLSALCAAEHSALHAASGLPGLAARALLTISHAFCSESTSHTWRGRVGVQAAARGVAACNGSGCSLQHVLGVQPAVRGVAAAIAKVAAWVAAWVAHPVAREHDEAVVRHERV